MKQIKPIKDNNVVIGDEWTGNDNVEYSCDCGRVLVRLRDAGHNNTIWWCKQCQFEVDISETEVRKKSKLETPRKNTEPAITSVGVTPDVSVRHIPEMRGGFAALAKKGTIRFTSYSTSEKE